MSGESLLVEGSEVSIESDLSGELRLSLLVVESVFEVVDVDLKSLLVFVFLIS